MHDKKLKQHFIIPIIIILILLSACTTTENARIYDDFVVVTANSGDTLSSLSEKYLDSAAMGEVIAEFNNIKTISSGQELVIPIKPFYPGGMMAKGYQTVPILVYHRIEEKKPTKMVVTIKAFKEQMKFLKDNNYQAITLNQLYHFMEFKQPLPKKSVVITFDDGWRSIYDMVYPVLKEYNFPATLFVYTDFIGVSKNALSWKQVQELSDNGFSIQCHTKSHRNLNKLKQSESFQEYFENLKKEIMHSKNLITKKINKKVEFLAYPYGETNNLAISLLEDSGFHGAFTVKRGSTPGFTNNFLVNRSMIYGEYTLKQFKKNLNIVKIR
jgi:peptidoglycan/xylan/chitin deacetylase (PgdA/CDA1 family)